MKIWNTPSLAAPHSKGLSGRSQHFLEGSWLQFSCSIIPRWPTWFTDHSESNPRKKQKDKNQEHMKSWEERRSDVCSRNMLPIQKIFILLQPNSPPQANFIFINLQKKLQCQMWDSSKPITQHVLVTQRAHAEGEAQLEYQIKTNPLPNED